MDTPCATSDFYEPCRGGGFTRVATLQLMRKTFDELQLNALRHRIGKLVTGQFNDPGVFLTRLFTVTRLFAQLLLRVILAASTLNSLTMANPRLAHIRVITFFTFADNEEKEQQLAEEQASSRNLIFL